MMLKARITNVVEAKLVRTPRKNKIHGHDVIHTLSCLPYPSAFLGE